MAPNVRATVREASKRADEVWASLQEHGSSFGEHPLNDLINRASADVEACRSDVA